MLLVLGEQSIDADTDWSSVFDAAAAERVAGVAWRRSGGLVRAHAPAPVVERWRSLSMRIALQAEMLVQVVGEAISGLRDAGVDAVVMKGAPLAQRLYGDFTVRPVADCDLFIPLAQRGTAGDVLARAGWTSRTGEPPAEETLERWAGGQRNVIEMHSSLIDDALLAHIRIPLESTVVCLNGHDVAAHAGDYLPAYLAAHMAKHETVPLLWVLDFHTLWTSSTDAERTRAVERASAVGLARHLAWARELAHCLTRGAAGDDAALATLAGLRRATGDLGRVRRLVAFSAGPMDAARVVAGRIWPEEWRDGWRAAPNYVLHRGAGWIARRLQLLGNHRPSATTRALAVDDAELMHLLGETLSRGLAIWIRPRGTSMQPAIPPSAAAHIVPVSVRAPRADDIVLARLPHGQFVLHRVQRMWEDTVQLKGDAMRRRDVIVERSAVIGVCDRVDVGGVQYRAEDRPRDPVALLTSTARTRLRRFVSPRGA